MVGDILHCAQAVGGRWDPMPVCACHRPCLPVPVVVEAGQEGWQTVSVGLTGKEGECSARLGETTACLPAVCACDLMPACAMAAVGRWNQAVSRGRLPFPCGLQVMPSCSGWGSDTLFYGRQACLGLYTTTACLCVVVATSVVCVYMPTLPIILEACLGGDRQAGNPR